MKNINLKSIFTLVILSGIILGSTCCHKPRIEPDPPTPPDPPASTLQIDSLKSQDVTKNSAILAFAVSGNKTIVSQQIKNSVTGTLYDVLGKTSLTLDQLNSSTSYTFTLTVKDASGKVQSKSVTVRTEDKISELVQIVSVTYSNPFAIVGNAQSNLLTIKIKNLSSSTKTLPSLEGNFGEYGKAVKMLRYMLNDTSRWIKTTTTGDNGSIEFRNLVLASGMNTLECYFSLLPQTGGVPNGSRLSFQLTSINDGEGAHLPNGTLPSAVEVGTVDANTEPTVVLTNSQTNIVLLSGNIIRGGMSQSSIFSLYFRVKGPSGVRFHSLRLKNPWWTFVGLEFDPNGWNYDDNRLNAPVENIPDIIWNSQNKFVTLVFPNLEYNKISSDGNKWYQANISGSFGNNSATMFDSDNFTPGEHGFILNSKYDIVIYNSLGQVVDMSDIMVNKNHVPYLDD